MEFHDWPCLVWHGLKSTHQKYWTLVHQHKSPPSLAKSWCNLGIDKRDACVSIGLILMSWVLLATLEVSIILNDTKNNLLERENFKMKQTHTLFNKSNK
jgi:hypothetical protein